ncbi:MAG: hypothetical protein PVJ09_05005 [Candidatus Woesebacteria bacterium]|jgi:hypothetical protein
MLIKTIRNFQREKNLLIYLLLALICAIAFFISIKPYLNQKFPYTHDGENHLARFANYKIALKEGQFPPRFAPNLLNHYGYPVFNYNYPLANILSLFFSFLKINYELIFKVIAVTAISLSLILVNQWLKILKFNQKARLFALSVFLVNPYLLNTIYFRGNIGEILAISLLPSFFYFIEVILKQKKLDLSFWQEKNTLISLVLITAFFLSHNITVLFAMPIIFVYALFKFKTKKNYWKIFIKVIALGILLTLWFWLPAVAEKSEIVLDQDQLANSFANYFPTLRELILSPLEFGFSNPSKIDSLGFNLGLSTIFILILAVILLIKEKFKKLSLKRDIKTQVIFFTIINLLLIIFQLKFTEELWLLIPLAKYIQFPWRLSLFISLLILPLAALIFSQIKQKWQIILIAVLFLQLKTYSQLKVADFFHKTKQDYDAFSQSTSTSNENRSKNFEYNEIADWRPSPSIMNGQGEIEVYEWRGSNRKYRIKIEQASIIVEPTMNFLGWKTRANGQKLVYINNDDIKGRLAYQLEAGEYQIESKFTQRTWARVLGNISSLITFFALSFFYLSKKINLDINKFIKIKIINDKKM